MVPRATRTGPGSEALTRRKFDEHKQLVAALIAGGHLSQRVKDPAQGAIIIAKGAEVGLPPMEALRQVYVVAGIAAIQSDGMRALLLRSGVVQIMDMECTPERAVVRMVRRNRQGDIIADYTATWTAERAREAGFKSPLYGNAGHRQTMLRHKATGEAARAVGPDIIGGMYTPEEFGVESLDQLTPQVVSMAVGEDLPIGEDAARDLQDLGASLLKAGVPKAEIEQLLLAAKDAAQVDYLADLTQERAATLRRSLEQLQAVHAAPATLEGEVVPDEPAEPEPGTATRLRPDGTLFDDGEEA